MTAPADEPLVVSLNGAEIEIWPDSLRITLADGSIVLAMAEDTDAYRATALANGYGDDAALLCRDHDIMHLALAYWLRTDSPTMGHVGQGVDAGEYVRGLEEDAVLAIQRYARARGIDLLNLFRHD